MNCRHCQYRRGCYSHRGLCGTCYGKRDVRGLYPAEDPAEREEAMTMEQVEAMIAEQMKCLPSWWHTDRAEYPPRKRKAK